MEKFKWIDFDPVADGKVKPKGIILNDGCDGNAGIGCNVFASCVPPSITCIPDGGCESMQSGCPWHYSC